MITNLKYDDFHKFLNSNELPTVIDIWAYGCPPCDGIESILTQMENRYGDQILRIGRINVDDNEEIAKEYRLRAVPTVLFFEKGALQNQLVVPKPDDLRSEIDNFVNF
ncbi:MAG: Thioredoxin C-1 [Candidatus Heimdallarchaeota archaeon LC_2]|nr:MAG: Thioredoxin C-1 [Candidatus Heimdallarchaeota archaeon LC_2]